MHLFRSLATGPLSPHDLLQAVHKLYFIEMTNKEVLEKIDNGQDLTHGKLDTLIEKVDRLDSRLPSGASVDIPGIGIVIDVKNCSAEKKKEVLDILEKNFIKAIEQKVSSLEESLPKGVLHTLRESSCTKTHQLWMEIPQWKKKPKELQCSPFNIQRWKKKTETRQQRRTTALSEEEDTSNPCLRRDSQLISDESTLIFQDPVVKTTGKVTQTSFHEGDMQIIKKIRCLPDKLQEFSRNINDPDTKTDIYILNQKAEGVCNCVTNAFTVTGSAVLKEKKKISRVPCPSRVDIERLSQTLLAFKRNLRTCTGEIVSLKSKIHNFIGANRCTIKLKEDEIKEARFEINILDMLQLTEKELSKYEDEANNKERGAVDLEIRARNLRRISGAFNIKASLWGTASAFVGILIEPFSCIKYSHDR
ncbi:uncharacterized protein LOC132717752 [Ruditapes philippinarum]|uniref:uncharacterized protein LOC132717752 n=1 Tax=Ruditapes philippinarum TaxID=129788 RepID=UPI00295C2569|nr:uncharacterized protein LOC132717752 [Ruditapes philippinarum]